MTPKEHELQVLMFARLFEAVGVLSDVLTSRGVLTGDDAKAFRHAVHHDPTKLLEHVSQAMLDYEKCAAQLGVETGLGKQLPIQPSS